LLRERIIGTKSIGDYAGISGVIGCVQRTAHPPLTGPRQFDIMQSGSGWQVRSIETAREGGT
jgi:hypothetical protein